MLIIIKKEIKWIHDRKYFHQCLGFILNKFGLFRIHMCTNELNDFHIYLHILSELCSFSTFYFIKYILKDEQDLLTQY